MVTTYLQRGDAVDFTVAGSAVSSGDPHLDGVRFGIVIADAAVGEVATKQTVGVFDGLPILGTDVVSGPGIPLYWDDGNSRLTITAAIGLVLVGYSMEAKGSGPTTIQARLDGAARLLET